MLNISPVLKWAGNINSLVSDWDNLAHHQAMLASPSYPTLLEALKPAYGGWSKMYHVIFNAQPIALKQPVTEVLLLTIKNPSHRTEVFDILTKISDSTKKMLVFGPALEDKNVIIVVGGWQSVEVCVEGIAIFGCADTIEFKAHWQMVANPEPKAALERLYTLASRDHLFHSTLTPFSGK